MWPSQNTKSKCNRPQMFFKIGILKKSANFTGKHLYWSLFFHKVADPSLVSCEICENFKNNFFYRTRPMAASHRKSNLW